MVLVISPFNRASHQISQMNFQIDFEQKNQKKNFGNDTRTYEEIVDIADNLLESPEFIEKIIARPTQNF